MYSMQSNASLLSIIYNFHAMLLLVNVMFASNLVNLMVSTKNSYFKTACHAFHA